MEKIVVSACLLGENCKYNGGNNFCRAVVDFIGDQPVIPVCPEIAAGLGCPRTPMEIVDGVLTDKTGRVVDKEMRLAVAAILDSLKTEQVRCAILKSRSPTCGARQIYDGTFSGTLIPGAGVLAQALTDAGYQVIDSEEIFPAGEPAKNL